MFCPSDTAFNEWLFSEESFRNLYGGSDSGSDSDKGDADDTRLPRARKSCKLFYLVQDRYDSFFFSAYLSPLAFENGIEDCESRLGKKFRRCFRVPYVVFVEICEDIERILGERAGVDRTGDKTIQIGLMVGITAGFRLWLYI